MMKKIFLQIILLTMSIGCTSTHLAIKNFSDKNLIFEFRGRSDSGGSGFCLKQSKKCIEISLGYTGERIFVIDEGILIYVAKSYDKIEFLDEIKLKAENEDIILDKNNILVRKMGSGYEYLLKNPFKKNLTSYKEILLYVGEIRINGKEDVIPQMSIIWKYYNMQRGY